MNEIMDIQSQISFEINQKKIGKTYKCVIDRKETPEFIKFDIINDYLQNNENILISAHGNSVRCNIISNM